MRRLLLALLILVAAPAHAQTTWFVRATGSDAANGLAPATAFRTIARANAVAASGDTVVVGAGTYTESITAAPSNLTITADVGGGATGDPGPVVLAHASLTPLTLNGRGTWTINSLTIRRTGGGTALSLTGGSMLNLVGVTFDGSPAVAIAKAGPLRLSGCLLTGYTATGVNSASGSLSVTATTFIAPDGATSVTHASSTATINTSRFTGGAVGVQATGGTTNLNNCIVERTTTHGVAKLTGATVNIRNCTLANNTGAAARAQGAGATTITNTIVAFNGFAFSNNGSGQNATRCLVHGNATLLQEGGTNQSNTITGDPAFADLAGGDYRITAGSAAIDAADATAQTSDYLGIVRAGWGTAPDIGAFEFTSMAPAAVPYTQSFEAATVGAEWRYRTTANAGATVTRVSGPFSNAGAPGGTQQALTLHVTPGVELTITFDLLALDSWDGESFTVVAGGQQVFSQTFQHNAPSSIGSPSFGPVEFSGPLGGNTGWADQVYRRCWGRFTPTSTPVTITFSSTIDQGWNDEGWAIDNVDVRPSALPVVTATQGYTTAFPGVAGPEWSSMTTNTNATFGRSTGTFGLSGSTRQSQQLSLAVTPGVTHYLAYDLLLFGSWEGSSTTNGPDAFTVLVDGAAAATDTFSTLDASAQSHPRNPDAYTAGQHAVYRRRWLAFTPAAGVVRVTFRGDQGEAVANESWAVANVAVRQAGDPLLFNTSAPGGAAVNSLPRFRDATAAVGLNLSWPEASADTGGLHVADLNNDGLQDLVVGGGATAHRVLVSMPGFNTVAMNAVAFASGAVARFGVLLDYDRDGFMDYHGFDRTTAPGALYRGAATLGPAWIGVTPAGLSAIGERRAVAALDLDANGATDLAVFDGWNPVWAALNRTADTDSNPPTPTFAPETTTFAQQGGWGYLAASADIDNTGRPTIFYSLDTGRLWAPAANNTYALSSRGISVPNNSGAFAPAFADFNNDGWTDLAIAAQWWNAPALFRNPGNATGNFVNVNDAAAATAAGLPHAAITPPNLQRGLAWGDYDNDGLLDLYVCTATGGRLYRNAGNGAFTLAAEACSPLGDAADAVFADYDNDGDLDLVVAMASGATARVFENISNVAAPNTAYLKVRVITRDAAGTPTQQDARARVELRSADGSTLLQRRDVGALRGLGEEPLWAHFGGVEPNTAYRVRVHLPGMTAPWSSPPITPAQVSTTINGRTISRLFTAQVETSRPRIINWTQVDPNP